MMGKWHQAPCVANRNMCHHRFVPPPVAYDSWGMLMTSIPHVSAMSHPKPSLSINYGQDEIRVSIRQPFISRSLGDPAQGNICCFFFFFFVPLRTKNKRCKEMNQSELPNTCLVTVNNKEEVHLESLFPFSPHQLPPGCHGDFLSRGWHWSAPLRGSWEIR